MALVFTTVLSNSVQAQENCVPAEGESIPQWLSHNPLLYWGTPEEFIEQVQELERYLESYFQDRGIAKISDMYLTKNPEIQRIKGEYHSAGKILPLGEKLPQLAEGKTIYIIFKRDGLLRLIYETEVPNLNVDPESDEILVTHRSLEQKLLETGGYQGILVPGEIKTVNGRNKEDNNRSNTFHSSQDNLDLGIIYLKDIGLNIEPKTKFGNYGDPEYVKKVNTITHGESLAVAKVLVKYSAPKYLGTLDELREAYKNLAERFPDPESPGEADVSAMGAAYGKKLEAGVEDEHLYAAWSNSNIIVANGLLAIFNNEMFTAGENEGAGLIAIKELCSVFNKVAGYKTEVQNVEVKKDLFDPKNGVTQKDVKLLIDDKYIEQWYAAATNPELGKSEQLKELMRLQQVLEDLSSLELSSPQATAVVRTQMNVGKAIVLVSAPQPEQISAKDKICDRLKINRASTDKEIDTKVSESIPDLFAKGVQGPDEISAFTDYYSYIKDRMVNMSPSNPLWGELDQQMAMLDMFLKSMTGFSCSETLGLLTNNNSAMNELLMKSSLKEGIDIRAKIKETEDVMDIKKSR